MKLARKHGCGWCAVAVAGVVIAALSTAVAQTPPPFNEREVRKELNAQDRDDIWVLDFKFHDPRLITVDIPGVKGRKVVWYLWYQISNRTGKPQTFTPDFELVTHDRPHVYHDQVLPKVQDAIRRVEDPAGHLDIKNSVTIGSEPIPPSKANAYPKVVTGVATWYDVDPDASNFSIFVSGLSNGWSEDDNKVVRRKTLQLQFKRVGDKYVMDSRQIRFVPPEKWIYRATTFKTPDEGAPKEKTSALPPESPPSVNSGSSGGAATPPVHERIPLKRSVLR